MYIFRACLLCLWLGSSALTALDVPITVRETAGVGTSAYPVSVVVPLEKGRFQSTEALHLVDEAGTPVPAQVQVLNRHWASDGSLRHVQVHFLASVAPFTSPGTGQTVFFLRDGGTSPPPLRR